MPTKAPRAPAPDPDRAAITQWLVRFTAGDSEAGPAVLDLLYRELHRIARRYMSRERPEHTLQTTALLHEAYLDLVDQKERTWQNRGHFLAAAAQAMRRILIDYARARLSRKRGGEAIHLEMSAEAVVTMQRPE